MAVNVAHVPIFPESLQVVTWVEKGCIHTGCRNEGPEHRWAHVTQITKALASLKEEHIFSSFWDSCQKTFLFYFFGDRVSLYNPEPQNPVLELPM